MKDRNPGDFSLNHATQVLRGVDPNRRYTLAEVTAAAGVALARARTERTIERAVLIYSDILIEELKRG